MTRPAVFAAIDLGAESGRVVCGRLVGDRVELDEPYRFPNRPVRLPDGLRWNLLSLYSAALDGLRAAGSESTLRSVGVDSWGVDYALLDARGRVLGLPFHYRDERTVGMVERAHARVGREEMYRTTGIQTMPINTVFQLLAEEGESLAAASRIALVPDLLTSWLGGTLANEATAASTTGLLDARSGRWADELIDKLGLPSRIFGELVEPGTLVGSLLPHHELGAVPVCAVAGHDTASAFVAAPLRDRGSAVLSSGTWSLLGLELDEPVLGEEALAFNLSNERGIDGTTRLLRNVMGLWLLQELRRSLEPSGAREYEDLLRLAEAASDDVPLFDPDDEDLLRPGDDMPKRIAAACVRAGQEPPSSTGQLVRSILVSLACQYRVVLERLEQVTGRSIETIHVIGGGARNALLCQITADLLGRRVLAGPVEATALGNVLIQARAAGELANLEQMRAVAAASAQLVTYEPRSDAAGDDTYGGFLEATRFQQAMTAHPHERTTT